MYVTKDSPAMPLCLLIKNNKDSWDQTGKSFLRAIHLRHLCVEIDTKQCH